MVADDTPNAARRGRTAMWSSRLDVLQLPAVWERRPVRIYRGSRAFRARPGTDCDVDRGLSFQPRAKCLCIRSTADSRTLGRSAGLPSLAARDDNDASGVGCPSVVDFVHEDLER